MPAKKFDGECLAMTMAAPLFVLARRKHYVGLYVMAPQALKDMAKELAGIDHVKELA